MELVVLFSCVRSADSNGKDSKPDSVLDTVKPLSNSSKSC